VIDEIEVSELETDKYGREVRIDRWEYLNQGGTYFAWMKRPIANLETRIPEGVKWSAVILEPALCSDDGEEISPAITRQKTVLEFVGGEDKVVRFDDGTALIPACALNPSFRQSRVSKGDLDDWAYYGLQAWGEEIKFLSIAERDALLADKEA